MHIRFFINTLGEGGAEKVLIDLLSMLVHRGVQCDLITVSGGIRTCSLPKEVHHFQIVKNNGWLGTLQKKIVYHLPPWLFCSLFVKGKRDVEIAYLEGFPTHMLSYKCGPKLAFIHFDIATENMIEKNYKTAEDCLREYEKYTNTCFVSSKALEGFNRTVGKLKNGIVMRNVLDLAPLIRGSMEKCQEDYKTNGLKIISLGRLVHSKGYDRLLKIVKQMEQKYAFELWILGDGPMEEQIKRFIAGNNIRSVRVFRFQKNPYPFLKKADLFICASYSEGAGMAVAEANALGIPVLSTECGCVRETLQTATTMAGWVTENSEDALACQLEKLLANPNLVSECREKIQKYNLKNAVDRQIDPYINLLQKITNKIG